MGRKGKAPKDGLGKQLMNAKKKRNMGPASDKHSVDYANESEVRHKASLLSITERNALDDFLDEAILSEKNFEAERGVKLVLNTKVVNVHKSIKMDKKDEQEKHLSKLQVPRRPRWDGKETPEQFVKREKEAFLVWRRTLADMEARGDLVLTPFEKNIDVWRQLWRVLERSDVIVQIVDARDPMFFYCPDLVEYVKEYFPHKQVIMLINKADFLSQEQRFEWRRYLTSQSIRFAFFSAVEEQAKVDEELHDQRAAIIEGFKESGSDGGDGSDGEGSSDADEDGNGSAADADEQAQGAEEGQEVEGDEEEEEDVVAAASEADVTGAAVGIEGEITRSAGGKEGRVDGQDSMGPCEPHALPECGGMAVPLTRLQVLQLLRNIGQSIIREKGRVVVGMIGYPNVGKSSTINVLCGTKRVSVSATPGKTKHFQTLELDHDLTLCDCPGLVFPAIAGSKADMIVNGLIPVHTMRDHKPAVDIVCQRIKRSTLEGMYGVIIPAPADHEPQDRPPTASELLQPYAAIRGFMTVHGAPDEARAARLIIQDYCNGKLTYVHPPPDFPDSEKWRDEMMVAHVKEAIANTEKKTKQKAPRDVHMVDDHFVEMTSGVQACFKGSRQGKMKMTKKKERQQQRQQQNAVATAAGASKAPGALPVSVRLEKRGNTVSQAKP